HGARAEAPEPALPPGAHFQFAEDTARQTCTEPPPIVTSALPSGVKRRLSGCLPGCSSERVGRQVAVFQSLTTGSLPDVTPVAWTTASGRASAVRISSGCWLQSRVLPSMSVKRKVMVSVAGADMGATRT